MANLQKAKSLAHRVYAVIHKDTTTAKRHMMFRESTFDSFFHSFSCHVTFRQYFFSKLSDDVIFSVTTRLYFGWTRADPQSKRGFHWDWLLLSFSQLIFEESAGDAQHIYPQPLTLSTIHHLQQALAVLMHNDTNIYTDVIHVYI